MKKEVLSIYIDNKANVLSRVIGLYGRRGFNIDSMTVSATNDPEVSRVTLTFAGDHLTLNQIVTQTQKLECVRAVKKLNYDRSFFRELLMVRVKADGVLRSKVKEVSDIYRAKIIHLETDSMVLELTGRPEKLDAFMEILNEFEVLDVCRTGISGIEK